MGNLLKREKMMRLSLHTFCFLSYTYLCNLFGKIFIIYLQTYLIMYIIYYVNLFWKGGKNMTTMTGVHCTVEQKKIDPPFRCEDH